MSQFSRRRAALALGVTTAVVIVGLALPVAAAHATAPPTGDNAFSDTFTTGSASWASPSGQWQLNSNEYRQTQLNQGGASTVVTGRDFTDANYSVDLRLLDAGNDSTDWAGIQFKKMGESDSPFDSGYTLFVRANGQIVLYRVNTTLATGSTAVDLHSTHRLTVKDVGGSISVYIDGSTTPVLSAVDKVFAHGSFGLTTFSSSWAFDNVAISANKPAYRISVGGKQLLYSNAAMDALGREIDGSFVTSKGTNGAVDTTMVFGSTWLERYTGPNDEPFATRLSTSTNQQWINLSVVDTSVYAVYHVWLQNIYWVSSTERLAFTHNEAQRVGESAGTLPDYSLGLAWSTDSGVTWRYLGTIAMPGNAKLNVGGVPFITRSGNFYAYYNDGTAGEPTGAGAWVRHSSVVSANVAAVIAAARQGTVSVWKKYVNGAFTGQATGTSASPTAPQGSTVIPSVFGSPDLHSDAVYNTVLSKYLLTQQDQLTGRLMIWSSADGLNWSMEAVADHAPQSYMNPYSSFVDPDGPSNDMSTVDGAFWLMFDEKGCPNTGGSYSDDNVYRSAITVETTAGSSYSATAGFSSTQSTNQWKYEQQNTDGSFSPMSWDVTNQRWKGTNTYTLATSTGQHPDTSNSVRTWVAPQAGVVRVQGRAAKSADSAGGDGVRVKILKNTGQVWPSGGWQSIGASDSVGVSQDFPVAVAAGDVIRFVVNANATITSDSTSWAPVITYDSYGAASGFSSTQGAHNWSYITATGGTGTPMTWDSSQSRWQGVSTYNLVGDGWQHPDASPTARVWTAPRAGVVSISSTIAKRDSGGDGVYYRVTRNGSSVLPASGSWYLGGTNMTGVTLDTSVAVQAGDRIGFEVSKGTSNQNDATNWNPSITYVG